MAMKYVLERMNGVVREWYTGLSWPREQWSDVAIDAMWFDSEMDANVEINAGLLDGTPVGYEVGCDD